MSHKKTAIISLPNPHLRAPSAKAPVVTPAVKDLVKRMKAATLLWEAGRDHEVGVALAAVQIDELERVVIVRDDAQDKENTDFSVFINPEITAKEGEPVADYEGCLSVPDIYGLVPRYPKVTIRAMNLRGQYINLVAEDFLARIFQHEIDHTNGIVFVDHIKQDDAFFKLNEEGQLEKQQHEDILKSRILW